MIVAAEKHLGPPYAICTCDDCGAPHEVRADVVRVGQTWAANEGQVHKKLMKAGWRVARKKLSCPDCVQKQKENKVATKVEKSVETPSSVVPLPVSAPRAPSLSQRRQILEMLEVSYDIEKGRYNGHETDKTVAEAAGAGVLPGWVTEVREQFFGMNGGNSEIEEAAGQLEELRKTARELRDLIADQDQAISKLTAQQKDLRTRLTKIETDVTVEINRMAQIRKAIGPKAGG